MQFYMLISFHIVLRNRLLFYRATSLDLFFGFKNSVLQRCSFLVCIQLLSVPECRTDLVSNLAFPFNFLLPFRIVVFFGLFLFKFVFINSVFVVFRFK